MDPLHSRHAQDGVELLEGGIRVAGGVLDVVLGAEIQPLV